MNFEDAAIDAKVQVTISDVMFPAIYTGRIVSIFQRTKMARIVIENCIGYDGGAGVRDFSNLIGKRTVFYVSEMVLL